VTTSRRHFRSRAGFTLPELLIAMSLVLVVSGGALSAFSYALRASDLVTQKLEMNDQMRIALDLMVRDFIQVGQGLPATKVITLPAGGPTTPVRRPSPPGQNYVFPAGTTQLNAVTAGEGLGPVVDGVATDMITLVYADNLPCTTAACTDPFAPVNTTVTGGGLNVVVEAGRPIANVRDGIRAGDLMMFVSGGSAMQLVTTTPTNQTLVFGTNDPMNLNQRNADTGTILDLTGTTPVMTRIRMITYYLQTDANGPPRLIRRINMNEGRIVALGIDNLQFTYDLVDGAANPTDVANPATPNQIRKVNIVLGVRSQERSPQTGDFFRSSMATQVSFRSLALVDRYR
jgi:prepilin-type N-terminal cleavage/methylation domain-containing protein